MLFLRFDSEHKQATERGISVHFSGSAKVLVAEGLHVLENRTGSVVALVIRFSNVGGEDCVKRSVRTGKCSVASTELDELCKYGNEYPSKFVNDLYLRIVTAQKCSAALNARGWWLMGMWAS